MIPLENSDELVETTAPSGQQEYHQHQSKKQRTSISTMNTNNNKDKEEKQHQCQQDKEDDDDIAINDGEEEEEQTHREKKHQHQEIENVVHDEEAAGNGEVFHQHHSNDISIGSTTSPSYIVQHGGNCSQGFAAHKQASSVIQLRVEDKREEEPPHNGSTPHDDDTIETDQDELDQQQEEQKDPTKKVVSSTETTERSVARNNKGRRGDLRMHAAVAARLGNPQLSLFQALVIGGFRFPKINDDSNKDTPSLSCLNTTASSDRRIYDSDNVLLSQRKNQLSRRLRQIARKKRQEQPPLYQYPNQYNSSYLNSLPAADMVLNSMIMDTVAQGTSCTPGSSTNSLYSPRQSSTTVTSSPGHQFNSGAMHNSSFFNAGNNMHHKMYDTPQARMQKMKQLQLQQQQEQLASSSLPTPLYRNQGSNHNIPLSSLYSSVDFNRNELHQSQMFAPRQSHMNNNLSLPRNAALLQQQEQERKHIIDSSYTRRLIYQRKLDHAIILYEMEKEGLRKKALIAAGFIESELGEVNEEFRRIIKRREQGQSKV